MTRVEYPSAAVPGPPSLSLDITEGWSQVVVAGSLLAVRRDGTSSESQPNIVVTYIERELSFTPQDLVGEIGEALSRQTEGVSKPAYPALLGGHDFVIKDTAYREPEVRVNRARVQWCGAAIPFQNRCRRARGVPRSGNALATMRSSLSVDRD